MLFNPADVPDDTVEALLEADAEFADLNPRGYDQQVMNLVLYGRMGALSKSFATWFPFDQPSSRVASEARGWRGNEFPAIVHTWGARAPWLVKEPTDGDYFNERLGKSCRAVYLENLAAFETEFPKR
jgi:lipopolysaccharide biosynthesis glycosyltransferase